MTYGSPTGQDDVEPYITRVRGGKPPTPEVLAEFQRRYALIGGSPLIQISQRLARTVEKQLRDESPESSPRIAAAMRFSEPGVETVVNDLVGQGADRLLGVILSPQYSPLLMAGYVNTLANAAAAAGVASRTVGAWHLEPAFVRTLARRLTTTVAGLVARGADPPSVAILMTAHSLPRRVVDREPEYVDQLKETAQAVASEARLKPEDWFFAYQSAGHTPEEWLKPDMLDVLPELAERGYRHVVLAPVQFLADHLETLYDIDVAGREQAREAGFESFTRVPAPNGDEDLAGALAAIIRREFSAWAPVGGQQLQSVPA